MHMEPSEHPASIVMTDGRYATCALDRNGLHPARYVITKEQVHHAGLRSGHPGTTPRTKCWGKGPCRPGGAVHHGYRRRREIWTSFEIDDDL
ncbi:hypothetical protein ACNKHQ_18700 [Shigella flexneri]